MYRALPDDAARIFRLLGVIPCPTMSLAAVAALVGLPEPSTHRLLDLLVGAHLVEQSEPDRFAMHDLLVDYAGERVRKEETAEARDAASTRLTEWYMSKVDGAARLVDPHLPHLPLPAGLVSHAFSSAGEALDWLDGERVNILAIIDWAAAGMAPQTGWVMADAVMGYLHVRGYTLDRMSAARAMLDAARAAHPATGPRVMASAHLNLARTCTHLSSYEEAIDHCERAAGFSVAANWPYGKTAALTERSVAHGERGEIHTALTCAHRSLELSRRHGLRALQGRQLNNLGIGFLWHGALDQAEACFTEALTIHCEIGSLTSQNSSAISLAQLSLEAGRLGVAVDYLESIAELVSREGEIPEWPRVLNTLAAVHCAAGRYHEAIEVCHDALPIVQRQSDRVVQCSLLNNLGEALAGQGRLTDSVEAHEHALNLARATGTPRHQCGAMLGLARYHRLSGQLVEAAARAGDALGLARKSGRVWRAGQALTELAMTKLSAGELALAELHANEALAMHRRAGHLLCEARAARVLGDIAAAATATDDAHLWWTTAAEIFDAISAPEAVTMRRQIQAECPSGVTIRPFGMA